MKHTRIHITSSGPRTGSTLLAEAMRVCFDIVNFSQHEAPLSVSNSTFCEEGIVLTKQPSKTYGLNKILNFDKNLYVICLYRDPRDMVCSSHGADKSKYYCELNYWLSFFDDIKKIISHQRLLLISYEELSTNPDKIQKELTRRIKCLNFKFLFSEYHLVSNPSKASLLALNKLRPIDSSGIGNWKHHLPRVKQQIEKYGDITESLVFFKYENSKQWLAELKNVNSINCPSYRKYKNQKVSINVYIAILNKLIENIGLKPNTILLPFKYLKRFFIKNFK